MSEIIENAQWAVERLECEDWEYTPFEPYCHRLTCKRCLLSRAVTDLAAAVARAAALEAERDQYRAALEMADEMARLTAWGITVGDCREACEHPACLILRAIARYRRARAVLAGRE